MAILQGGEGDEVLAQPLKAAAGKRLMAIFHNGGKMIVKKYYCKGQHQKWGRVNQKWGIAPFATPWLRYCVEGEREGRGGRKSSSAHRLE